MAALNPAVWAPGGAGEPRGGIRIYIRRRDSEATLNCSAGGAFSRTAVLLVPGTPPSHCQRNIQSRFSARSRIDLCASGATPRAACVFCSLPAMWPWAVLFQTLVLPPVQGGLGPCPALRGPSKEPEVPIFMCPEFLCWLYPTCILRTRPYLHVSPRGHPKIKGRHLCPPGFDLFSLGKVIDRVWDNRFCNSFCPSSTWP